MKPSFAEKLRLFALIILLAASGANAMELNGIHLPDTVTVENKNLMLNGLGERLATIFHVKVYVGGLYLEAKEHDANAILSSKTLKRLDLVFQRDVDAGKIRDAWAEGFEKLCGNCTEIKTEIARLQALTTDVKDGQTLTYIFHPNDAQLLFPSTQPQTIGNGAAGGTFQRRLLEVFIGAHPPNDELKNGLLGLSSGN